MGARYFVIARMHGALTAGRRLPALPGQGHMRWLLFCNCCTCGVMACARAAVQQGRAGGRHVQPPCSECLIRGKVRACGGMCISSLGTRCHIIAWKGLVQRRDSVAREASRSRPDHQITPDQIRERGSRRAPRLARRSAGRRRSLAGRTARCSRAAGRCRGCRRNRGRRCSRGRRGGSPRSCTWGCVCVFCV